MNIPRTVLSIIPLSLALVALFAYSFATAQQWQTPPGNPPNQNRPAPVNVGTGEQVKQGTLGANEFRSNRYCNSAGNNCYQAGGVVQGCQLQYRFFVRNQDGPWQSLRFDGTSSHIGGRSHISRHSWSSEECRGQGCGIQMQLLCGSALTQWQTTEWTPSISPCNTSPTNAPAGQAYFPMTQTRTVSCPSASCTGARPAATRTCYLGPYPIAGGGGGWGGGQ